MALPEKVIPSSTPYLAISSDIMFDYSAGIVRTRRLFTTNLHVRLSLVIVSELKHHYHQKLC
jgi:hypothetical protein